jgi:hypothetical protein
MSQNETQRLLDFVRQLPVGPAYAPIYAKGQVFGKYGDVSTGKAPHERSHHTVMSPADVALLIEQKPDVFKAVGLFTGIRSGGLVILDVDANLATLRKKWGDSLEGAPKVTSTKANAAKFIFRVPEDQRSKVKGISGKVTGQGYEVLWGMQGVIAGQYPGSSDGKAPEGFYALQGDMGNIPEAPEWLLAEMRAAKEAEAPAQGLIKNRKGLDFSGRTEDELHALVHDCLSVLPHLGRGTEDYWWSIGAMIAEVLPNERGLLLWSNWSSEDPAFEADWERGNPCEAKWPHILKRAGRPGNKGLGSLIFLADEYDSNRERFTDLSKATLQQVEAERVQRWENAYLDGKEVLEQAYKLEEEIDNPALLDQAKHVLALRAGRTQGAQAIDKMLDADMAYERSKNLAPTPVAELEDTPFEYLIPGLLPKPWTLLIHADGGTGKTAMCQTIAKHLAQGRPFDCFGGMVDVPKSKVLWLNGDQNERIVRRQFMQLGVDKGVDVIGEWDMMWYRKFRRIQKKHKYDLVVIDSLDGCNDSNPYEENRREFALPLKKLARRNGIDFDACTIIVIHHNTKNGTFRGTSAIRAAVDETWNMRKASQQEIVERGLLPMSRIVTVEKSRDDREGVEMTFRLLKDFTYQIRHLKAVEGPCRGPSEHVQALLELLRSEQRPWSLKDITEHGEFGESHLVRANEYALKKLEQQKLIERCAPPEGVMFKGRPPVYYRAKAERVPGFTSLTRGDSGKSFGKPENPAVERDLSFPKAFGKVGFRKSPDGVADLGADETQASQAETETFPKGDFSETLRKTQKPVVDSDLDFSDATRTNRVSMDLVSAERARDREAHGWD